MVYYLSEVYLRMSVGSSKLFSDEGAIHDSPIVYTLELSLNFCVGQLLEKLIATGLILKGFSGLQLTSISVLLNLKCRDIDIV